MESRSTLPEAGIISKKRRARNQVTDLFVAPAADETTEFDGFLILTTPANEVTQPIYNRMPVIVRSEMCDTWPDLESTPEILADILEYPRNDGLMVYKDSPPANNVRNETAKCVMPV